jgi:hypothetical protein
MRKIRLVFFDFLEQSFEDDINRFEQMFKVGIGVEVIKIEHFFQNFAMRKFNVYDRGHYQI